MYTYSIWNLYPFNQAFNRNLTLSDSMTHIKYCKCSVYSNIFVLVYSLRPVLRLIIDRVKQKIIILYTMSLLLTYWTMTSCVRTWSATCTWRFMQWNLLMLAYSLFVWSNITYNCNEIVLLAARSNWRILSVKKHVTYDPDEMKATQILFRLTFSRLCRDAYNTLFSPRSICLMGWSL